MECMRFTLCGQVWQIFGEVARVPEKTMRGEAYNDGRKTSSVIRLFVCIDTRAAICDEADGASLLRIGAGGFRL